MSAMTLTRAKLIRRFESLPDAQAHAGDFARLVYLIGWCERNGSASDQQYLAEVHRIKSTEEGR